MATAMVHVRVDEKTKQRAAKTLAAMGISVSDAVRMLLIRVAAEKALPFDVKIPHATPVKAMRPPTKAREGALIPRTHSLWNNAKKYSGYTP